MMLYFIEKRPLSKHFKENKNLNTIKELIRVLLKNSIVS